MTPANDTNPQLRPLILVTNDDGYQAGGVKALARFACNYGDVMVVAPLHMQSAKSNALTVYDPLRVIPVRETPGLQVFAVNGTPTDCVKIAIDQLAAGRRPSLVLSGINHGFNLGINVLYSGTMGAAFEATIHHLQCVALSFGSYEPDADFTPCMPIAERVVERVLCNSLPKGVCLNVNIPKVPEIKGMKVTTTSMGMWQKEFERRIDPHNIPYYWTSGTYVPDNPDDTATDWYWTQRGYATITPCQADQTAHNAVAAVQKLLNC